MKETSTTKTEADPSERHPGGSRLGIVWLSPQRRVDWLVDGATLGREEACAIHLRGSEISRAHAKITRDGPLWLIRDLNSKNGTSVGGKKQHLSVLEEQSVLRVGEWVGVVVLLPADVTDDELFVELRPGFILGAKTARHVCQARRVAEQDIPILIQGETGTGKELMAQAVHEWSGRAGRMVALNCAAIPEAVAEAELFGYRKGAFTGAEQSSEGYIAAADRGSLFLDEVLDLPKAIQTKLLRSLEQRTVAPLGSTQSKAVDFRLIAASQEPLEQLVEEGEFRRDLYARLAGAEIKLPPLRRRREEILPLFQWALAERAGTATELEPRLIETLCLWHWKSNVREVVQLARLLAASGKQRLRLEDLPHKYREAVGTVGESKPDEEPLVTPGRRQAWLSRHAEELARLNVALEQCHGNLSEASRRTGIPRYRARRMLMAAAEQENVS